MTDDDDLEKWQLRQIVKSRVENAINCVIETCSTIQGEFPPSNILQFYENSHNLEESAILMAIHAHGLQQNYSATTNDISTTTNNSISILSNNSCSNSNNSSNRSTIINEDNNVDNSINSHVVLPSQQQQQQLLLAMPSSSSSRLVNNSTNSTGTGSRMDSSLAMAIAGQFPLLSLPLNYDNDDDENGSFVYNNSGDDDNDSEDDDGVDGYSGDENLNLSSTGLNVNANNHDDIHDSLQNIHDNISNLMETAISVAILKQGLGLLEPHR